MGISQNSERQLNELVELTGHSLVVIALMLSINAEV
jgi:hypothetical protein